MNSRFIFPFYSLLVVLFTLSNQQMLIAQEHHYDSTLVRPPVHGHNHAIEQKIYFPDLPNTKTISCDFHMHTVFSDGSVWPDIRVSEAVREGIDCISTTEHLEYQPHSKDIPHPDRNRAYILAKASARNTDLIVIAGTEITRQMPPGHSNAIFINDANPILTEDPMDAFAEAAGQGAFIFTNHPQWTAQRKDGIARYDPMHLELIEKNILNGIEIVNEHSYSDEALQLALDYNLTLVGTSDVHGLTDWMYDIPHGGHRPVTLVFANERGPEAIRKALFNRQTVVWFNDLFIGRQKWLMPILKASLPIRVIGYQSDTQILEVQLVNATHSRFTLRNTTDYTFHKDASVFMIEPQSTKTLLVKTMQRLDKVELKFEFLNGILAPNKHPVIEYTFTVEE
tara:strand:+ start:5781 stop:6968 length:1188 start_codon:yes stop_codon:yes gene_type:complete